MDTKVLKRDEIDDQKWDSCVHFAPNGNIFSYTWYLDCIYDNWHGIVESGYTSVMPIFVKKKEFSNKNIFKIVILFLTQGCLLVMLPPQKE